MSAPKLFESKIVLLSVIIIFIHEKPLSTTVSDYGTNKYNNNSFLIFGKAASITELPSKSLTVSGDYLFFWITCNCLSISFIVFCDLYFLAFVNARRDLMFFSNPEILCAHSKRQVYT